MKSPNGMGLDPSNSTFVFDADLLEVEGRNFSAEELIEVKPYGVSVGTDFARPFLLLKDEAHKYTLPVAVNPIEAGVTLSQANKSVAPTTPHKFTQLLMESLQIQVEKCVFVEIKGHFQYVRLYLKNHPYTKSIKLRADEAMSLCLYLNIPIYVTADFVEKSRVMSSEMDTVAKDISAHPRIMEKKHTYIM